MKTTLENIDDRIEEWHLNPNTEIPLHEYLGLSIETYATWVRTGELREPSSHHEYFIVMLNLAATEGKLDANHPPETEPEKIPHPFKDGYL
jgi:hypothetical protein